VKANQATFPVRQMCRLLKVSVSGFYAWRDRPMSQRRCADVALLACIQAIHRKSRGCYGAPNIHAELREEHGTRVGCKRVARLMRTAGLKGVTPRAFVRTTTSEAGAAARTDLVNRRFRATATDQLWVADVTYIPTRAGFLYLAIVLDVFSRKVVGWSIEDHLRTELVLAALNAAIAQRRPKNVIHHSDHGAQYTSENFAKRCRQMNVLPSMGTVGDAYDNAMAESFFASLEREVLSRRTFKTHAEARLAIFEWIEGWYNPHRRHSGIGRLSPNNFERRIRQPQQAEMR
jgi:putative transposase